MRIIHFFVVSAALFVALAAQTSQAAIIASALRPGLNTLNDRDAALLVDLFSDDIGTAGANGLINVGDQIESLLIIDNISNSFFGGTPLGAAVGDATYQMTAHSIATILTKTPVVGPPGIFLFTASFSADVFEDSSSLANTILTDFSSQSAAAAILAGTDGSKILTVDTSGFGTSPVTPDVFRVLGADDFTLLVTGNEANFIGALDVIFNPMILPILADATLSGAVGSPPGTGSLHDVVLVGEEEVASAAVAARGWDAQSDTTISFTTAAVPEPLSLLIWGGIVGLVGMIAANRTRR